MHQSINWSALMITLIRKSQDVRALQNWPLGFQISVSLKCFTDVKHLLSVLCHSLHYFACVCVCVFHEWCCWKFVCVLLRVWRCTMTSGLHHHCFAKPCFKGFTIQIIIPRLIAMMELPGTALNGAKWIKTEWKISDTFQEPLCVCR